MPQITATATFNGLLLKNLPVVNPGDWFGKTWIVEIGGSYFPLYLIVEADSVCGVIDELAESEEHGHHIVVLPEDLGDYDLESCHYGPSGQVLDLDHLMIYGTEGSNQPFKCRYHGDHLPSEGVEPTEMNDWLEV
ncbi:hypothetical protein C5Y96_18945 [Blastopirellula marina]|uniref:Uncharacterized protein n=1 Tax=Blastopirellula marina TaxID=124 RepID=A0A2S8F614_9BACT|nr:MULTISPECIES: hypothetical protein [Pirellulaceae]PQO27605.1 hypothetical protein C5Y96_18945 [Blastopirellula marina]RCS48142.1 hypothetical protein DTL36_18970 [Bremerella cremea]